MFPLLTLATTERVLPIRHLSNDLFADFICAAPINGMCLGLIRLSGYNDHYFFDEVNKDNRSPVVCPKCGSRFVYRWTREGVLLSTPEAPDA